jgi:hypothetical protein
MRATRGRVIAAAVQGGVLRYLVHEDGAFVREDGRRVLEGELRPDWQFRLHGETTLIARGSDVAALGPEGLSARFTADCAGRDTALAANATCRFRVEGGRLLRTGVGRGLLGAEDVRLGDVLAGQTRIWAGERLGFGLYRAGSLSVAFVFDAERPGLTDSVRLPYPAGQVLGYEVLFGEDRIWVLSAIQTAGRTVHVATRLRPDGTTDATTQGEAGDGSWLGTLGGKCAVGRSLLAATDAGVVRVEERAGDLVETRRFADTEPFVTAASGLHSGPDGLFVVEPQAVWRLRTS